MADCHQALAEGLRSPQSIVGRESSGLHALNLCSTRCIQSSDEVPAIFGIAPQTFVASKGQSSMKFLARLHGGVLFLFFVRGAACAIGQSAAVNPPDARDLPAYEGGQSQVALPEAPAPEPSGSQAKGTADPGSKTQDLKTAEQADRPQQTKRILGVIPNFRSVSTNDVLPPQTPKEKFLTATNDSFDYSAVFIPATLAGYSMARRAYPEFGDGADAYGKYFWRSAVDQTTENYMVEFVGPVLFREDNRYYTLGRGGFLKRTGYALSRAVVTRTDSAKPSFNYSEVLGSGASAGLSNAYYPAQERTFGNTASTWGLDILIDCGSFVVKEFWPDINHHWQHRVNRASQGQ